MRKPDMHLIPQPAASTASHGFTSISMAIVRTADSLREIIWRACYGIYTLRYWVPTALDGWN